MIDITMFGLALAPLYAAIAQVESDRGATSANVYQIRDIYIKDVNQIMMRPGWRCYPGFIVSDKFSKDKSEDMMRVYWAYWGEHYEEKTGKPVSYEVLARIHNGGPLGWKKPETVGYWNRVAAVMKGGAK